MSAALPPVIDATGGYYVDSDFEPITWTADQLGPAIFYYEGKLSESFLTVYS